ncbi:expressed unknown protein [Seminavis robusta]|uniref:Transmembrane protein n=1 Tax=Seminavis robusta TaxID=568900 RepID=A0A9N8D8F4_9STRA|nr:expressed unknown protein [Seminavis robusta]|eukprot:Sro1_g000450.1 n/a (216) ;mRNA; f:124638-125285
MIASISTTLSQALPLSTDAFFADAVNIAAVVLGVCSFAWLLREWRSLDEGILEDQGAYFCAEHEKSEEEEGESSESGNRFLDRFTWLQREWRSLDEGILEDCGSYFCAEQENSEEGESSDSGNLFLVMAQAATVPFAKSMGAETIAETIAETDESESEDEEEETEPCKETEDDMPVKGSSLTSRPSEPELWRMVLSTGASFKQGPRRSFVHLESS